MDEPRAQKFLIVENDTKFAAWVQHAVGVLWPGDSVVIMDWSSFGRVRTAMTVRDYDIVMLGMAFDEGIEEPTTDSLDWVRKLRSQPGFPEMIVLAEGGSELAAVRTLRLGASDYLPKRLLTAPRLQRSIKLTLRGIEKENARRAERQAAVQKTDDKAKPAAPAPASPVSTHTGSNLAKAAALAVKPPPASLVSTQTGAGLAGAAKAALAAAPAHVATNTGASLAQAAKAAIAPVLSPVPSPRADANGKDPAAGSLPAVSVSGSITPSTPFPKQIAPENHQIPGYTILQKIGESEAAAVYLAIAEDLGHNVALKISKRKHSGDANVNDSGQRSRSSVHHRLVRLRHSRRRRIPRDGIFSVRRPEGAPAESADRRGSHRLPQGNCALAQGGA
jgi:DNA-binding NarL/FixJ family response regulator